MDHRPGRRPLAARALVVLALAALAVACLPALGLGATAIQTENALPGNPGWRYSDAPAGSAAQQYAGIVTSIQGYTAEQSAAPGGQVDLHVATTAGLRYRVEVYRLGWYGGAGARRVLCLPSCTGDRAGVVQPASPAPAPGTGLVRSGWTVTDTVPVGADWVSGYYLAQLVLTSGPDAGTARWVPFIVRPPAGSSSAVLVQVPVNTWLAYNGWGGKSLYDNKSTNGQRGNHVSFERPYWSGQYHLLDHEYQLVRYLEREGFDATYATDVDLHRNPGQVASHRLLMLAGHGEYWTRRMRDTAELARDSGVNIASMGANTAYWQVRYDDGEHTMVGYKSMSADPTTDPGDKTVTFRDLGRPECELLGVQYDNSWSVDAVARNYGVVSASAGHPWFQGTGYSAGASTTGETVGYEWDLITPGCNHPPLTALFHWDDGPGGFPPADAVSYTAPSGARVFSSGSMQFAWGLDGWRDGYTQTADTRLMSFMRNVIVDLTAGEPPPPPANQPPNASFSVTPTAPLVNQAVAFADTSTDPDGTIAARAWDLDNDGAFDDGTGASAQVTFPTAGTYTVRLRVTDDDGDSAVASRQVVVAATPPPPPPPASNLLSNPSFEANTSGWGAYQASLAREAQAGAPEGAYVVAVTRTAGSSFTIDDGARAVSSTTPGDSYTAEAWVKAASASSVGKPIQIKLRERDASGAVVADVASPDVALTNSWQKLSLSHVTTTQAGNLGLRISHGSAGTGDAFYADAFLLGGGGEPPPPPPNQPPNASFSVTPTAPLVNQAVAFADTSTDPDGTIAARAWDLDNDGAFDDGTGASAQVTFPTAGTYTVRLRVTDDDGDSAVASRQVVVSPVPANQPPNASFSQTPAAPVAGQQVSFADTSTDPDGTIAARAWDLDNDGAFDDGTGASAQVTFPTAGTYTVRLRVTDDDGDSAVASRQVVVSPVPANQPPNASFSQTPAAPVAGQQVSFADTSTDPDGTIAARAWDLDNDGAFDDGTGASAQVTFPTAGTYTVRLRVTDDDGDSAVASRQVVVAATPPPPPPPASNLLSNPSFEANTSGWGAYQASLAREAQAGAPEGAYVVAVTRTAGSSFTIDDGARAVSSTTPGDSYTAEAWVKAASASSVGKPIQIKLRERDASGAVVADVASPDVALTNSWQKLSLSHVTTTQAGNLGLRISHGSAGTGDAFYADALLLGPENTGPPPPNQAPSASFSQTPAAPVAGQQVSFADTSTDPDGTIAARAWDLDNDGAFDDGTGASAQVTFPTAGTYTVRLRVTDDDGDSAVASRQVVVSPVPANQPPNASFSQTPAAPVAGQQVSFADTSTDPDGTIAARAWDLDNDGAFDDGTGASAQVTFPTAGTYTVRLRVTDDDGDSAVASRQVVVAATPPPPPPPASNLLSNPSFEANTSGWGAYQASLAREAQAGAPEGAYVVAVTRTAGSSFTIDDGARAVSSTTPGDSYTAEAWVKAASASSVGKPIQIKLRERDASGAVVADVASPDVALTNSWQKLTLSRTVVTNGGNLGLRISHGSAGTGDAFYADALLLGPGV